jgi:hypothetical protein
MRNFRYTYRSDDLRDGMALRRNHINLPEHGDDLFRLMSLPHHSTVLHQAKSHTSGSITFQGADHAMIEPSNVGSLDLRLGLLELLGAQAFEDTSTSPRKSKQRHIWICGCRVSQPGGGSARRRPYPVRGA